MSVYISLRLDEKTSQQLSKASVLQNKSRSALIRDYLEKGLKGDAYAADDDRLHAALKESLGELLDPAVKRLAAIGAKNAQMAGAEYIMLTYLAKLIMGADGGKVDELSEMARLRGIEILKAKDSRLDAIIKGAVKETEDYL